MILRYRVHENGMGRQTEGWRIWLLLLVKILRYTFHFHKSDINPQPKTPKLCCCWLLFLFEDDDEMIDENWPLVEQFRKMNIRNLLSQDFVIIWILVKEFKDLH